MWIQIILTPTTIQQGCTCITAYATPPCSLTMMNPKSAPTMLGATSSCPMGPSTMISCSLLSLSHGTTTLLIDFVIGEPYLMEMVGDFWAVDPIFKGCYGDSLLYSDTDLHQLRWWGIHLPTFQGEVPIPLAPSYRQVREPVVTKHSPHRAAASDTPVESLKAKHSSSKSSPQHLDSQAP